jgi:hypothetical protein
MSRSLKIIAIGTHDIHMNVSRRSRGTAPLTTTCGQNESLIVQMELKIDQIQQ